MRTTKKKRVRLRWLKIGERYKRGDYCWDQRTHPVQITATRGFPLTPQHHRFFRIEVVTATK